MKFDHSVVDTLYKSRVTLTVSSDYAVYWMFHVKRAEIQDVTACVILSKNAVSTCVSLSTVTSLRAA
jgi:hypothetical protein